ncbi:alpha/beta fold hydrolase [Pseudomonas japonica]|uniref:alpha/beta fold hydrolase n=1 Tax=Pseudomonas japonica TaxID=256466 RepID=UPI003828F454
MHNLTAVIAATVLQLGLLAGAQAAESAAPQIAPIAIGSHTGFAPLKHVKAGVLDVAYAEVGPADGPVVILLHGWPYDIHSYSDVAPALAEQGYRVLIPYARGYGETRFLSARTLRNGQPAALAEDLVAFMDALGIERAVLGGYDWGARTADIVAALWPQRVKGLVAVSGYLIGSQELGRKPLPPAAELQWWYQFYFATERGREGYAQNTHDFARLIWKTASPQWNFDDATYERSAAALTNPDHVAVSVYNYRWRLGLEKGEQRYDAIEKKLAAFPSIPVPTIALEGDANGAPHPPAEAYAKRYTGKYQYRLIEGGVGHNLPQEAPRAFAQAIVDVDRF